MRDEKSVDKMKVKKTKKSFERIKKNFNCDLCRKVFPSKVALRSHLQNFHIRKEEGKKFKCVKCSFSTTHCGNLKTHVKNVHEKIKRILHDTNVDNQSSEILLLQRPGYIRSMHNPIMVLVFQSRPFFKHNFIFFILNNVQFFILNNVRILTMFES